MSLPLNDFIVQSVSDEAILSLHTIFADTFVAALDLVERGNGELRIDIFYVITSIYQIFASDTPHYSME